MELPSDKWDLIVSTHSRLKAAGPTGETTEILKNGFNTQPPEGGWMREDKIVIVKIRFNTQPPEGGWYISKHINSRLPVSTHSRLKAAGRIRCNMGYQVGRFNTQPPEGGWGTEQQHLFHTRGFNTQPPEGGWWSMQPRQNWVHCFNTQPPEGGWHL